MLTNDINLNVLYTNCDCLTMNKKEELYALIATDNPDTIALSEILTKTSTLPAVEEYNNRVISNIDKGRGVVLYIKSSLYPQVISFDTAFEESV